MSGGKSVAGKKSKKDKRGRRAPTVNFNQDDKNLLNKTLSSPDFMAEFAKLGASGDVLSPGTPVASAIKPAPDTSGIMAKLAELSSIKPELPKSSIASLAIGGGATPFITSPSPSQIQVRTNTQCTHTFINPVNNEHKNVQTYYCGSNKENNNLGLFLSRSDVTLNTRLEYSDFFYGINLDFFYQSPNRFLIANICFPEYYIGVDLDFNEARKNRDKGQNQFMNVLNAAIEKINGFAKTGTTKNVLYTKVIYDFYVDILYIDIAKKRCLRYNPKELTYLSYAIDYDLNSISNGNTFHGWEYTGNIPNLWYDNQNFFLINRWMAVQDKDINKFDSEQQVIVRNFPYETRLIVSTDLYPLYMMYSLYEQLAFTELRTKVENNKSADVLNELHKYTRFMSYYVLGKAKQEQISKLEFTCNF